MMTQDELLEDYRRRVELIIAETSERKRLQALNRLWWRLHFAQHRRPEFIKALDRMEAHHARLAN